MPCPPPWAGCGLASGSRSRPRQRLLKGQLMSYVPLQASQMFVESDQNLPALPLFQSTVTGLWNRLSFCLNFRKASVVPVASAMILPAFEGPRYSRMLVSWSAVGAPSCISANPAMLASAIRPTVVFPKRVCFYLYPSSEHTKLELCPLKLALLAVIARLVLGGMSHSRRIRLLQECVNTCRGRILGRVEERDDFGCQSRFSWSSMKCKYHPSRQPVSFVSMFG